MLTEWILVFSNFYYSIVHSLIVNQHILTVHNIFGSSFQCSKLSNSIVHLHINQWTNFCEVPQSSRGNGFLQVLSQLMQYRQGGQLRIGIRVPIWPTKHNISIWYYNSCARAWIILTSDMDITSGTLPDK